MKKKAPLNTLSKEEYEKRLKKMILAGLGKIWVFWPPRLAVKARCKDPSRAGWWVCEQCKQSREKIEIDHIIPCIKPSEGFKTWDEYIASRFVYDPKLLQGLCHDCHRIKSKKENQERRDVMRGVRKGTEGQRGENI